jgi:hypothetical protein
MTSEFSFPGRVPRPRSMLKLRLLTQHGCARQFQREEKAEEGAQRRRQHWSLGFAVAQLVLIFFGQKKIRIIVTGQTNTAEMLLMRSRPGLLVCPIFFSSLTSSWTRFYNIYPRAQQKVYKGLVTAKEGLSRSTAFHKEDSDIRMLIDCMSL